MSLEDAKARLDHASELLALHWQDTLTEWDDQKYREFDEEFLKPLFVHVSAAMSAMDRLQDVLVRAKRDSRCDA
ncbi:MAG: hypothetical protein SGJ19_07115 [Planctomycetia bacterium]|nr:hypothetical protein [Planctomycetia bacterium]